MTRMITVATVIALATAVGPHAASAAPGDTYKVKKAACQERAKSMDFGIHFIKRNRWVNDCIAGKHPA